MLEYKAAAVAISMPAACVKKDIKPHFFFIQ